VIPAFARIHRQLHAKKAATVLLLIHDPRQVGE
jgi:hypothetical protein